MDGSRQRSSRRATESRLTFPRSAAGTVAGWMETLAGVGQLYRSVFELNVLGVA